MLAIAVALTRSWTAFYTRGLPPDLRSRRRDEIESDVWEQRSLDDFERTAAADTAVEVLLRLVLGAPADVIWRLEAGADARSGKGTEMNESKTMRGFFFAALAVAIIPAGLGVAVLAGNGELSSGERVLFGSLWIAAGATMAAGLFLSTTRPLLGIALVATGAIVISVGMYWIAFITLPIGAAIVYLAYRRARSTGWRLRGGDVPNATA
jgi:hypothetical protein